MIIEIIMGTLLLVGIGIKLYTRSTLKNFDGAGMVHHEDPNSKNKAIYIDVEIVKS